MASITKLEGDFVIELRIECAGEGYPPDTSVGEVGPQIGDEHITDIVYERAKYDYDSKTVKIVKTESILEGVDIENPEVKKLIGNLENLFAAEMAEALEESSL